MPPAHLLLEHVAEEVHCEPGGERQMPLVPQPSVQPAGQQRPLTQLLEAHTPGREQVAPAESGANQEAAPASDTRPEAQGWQRPPLREY